MAVADLAIGASPVVNNGLGGYWGKRIVVSGSLTYNTHKNGDFITRTLNALYPLFVIHGGDDGADRWVQMWCIQTITGFAIVPCHHRVPRLRPEESLHRQHRWMMELEPDLLVVFPGAHPNVARVAKTMNVDVLTITEEMLGLEMPGLNTG